MRNSCDQMRESCAHTITSLQRTISLTRLWTFQSKTRLEGFDCGRCLVFSVFIRIRQVFVLKLYCNMCLIARHGRNWLSIQFVQKHEEREGNYAEITVRNV